MCKNSHKTINLHHNHHLHSHHHHNHLHHGQNHQELLLEGGLLQHHPTSQLQVPAQNHHQNHFQKVFVLVEHRLVLVDNKLEEEEHSTEVVDIVQLQQIVVDTAILEHTVPLDIAPMVDIIVGIASCLFAVVYIRLLDKQQLLLLLFLLVQQLHTVLQRLEVQLSNFPISSIYSTHL
jgi:hypothetical protein